MAEFVPTYRGTVYPWHCELRAGDVVSVHSTMIEVKEKSIRFAHELRNDESGEVAATTVLIAVHIDTTTRRARPLPPDVGERAATLAAGGR